MRRPYDKLSKKCVVAIMAASMAMSIGAQTVICPMAVYADSPTSAGAGTAGTTTSNGETSAVNSGGTISGSTWSGGGTQNVSYTSTYIIDSGSNAPANIEPGSLVIRTTNSQDLTVSGHEERINDNQSSVTVNSTGTVVVTNNSGGVVVLGGGSAAVSNNYSDITINSDGNGTVTVNCGSASVNAGGTLTVTSNASGGETIVGSEGRMTVTSNMSGGQVLVSGGSATISENCGGGATVSGGTLIIKNISGGRVTVDGGGTATINSGMVLYATVNNGGTMSAPLITDVTLNDGGFISCGIMSGGSNVIRGSNVTITNLESGAAARFVGGDGTIVYNSGNAITNSGGNVTISNNIIGGTACLYASGTVIDNYGLVVLGSGSTPSYGTVTNNYGTAVLECGGTVVNNYVGGIISGSSGTVQNNYGGTLNSGISVSNQYWSVSVTGLGASYGASFRNISGGSYLQTISGGTDTGASGQITIRPAGGYELTAGGAMSGSTATYNYTLTKVGDNYVLTVSNLTGNAVISPEQLQLVLTAIRSATGSGDDNSDDGSEILPVYFSSVETIKMIDDMFNLAQKASGRKAPAEITLNLSAVRSFSSESAKTVFDYMNMIGKRFIFTVDGKKYQVYIPAGIRTKGKKFLKALAKLEETEKKEIVGPLKFAEIFRECGVTVSLIK